MTDFDLIEFKTQINAEVLQKEIVVSSQEEYAYWGDVMKLCKNKIRDVGNERKEYTKPIDEAKKRLMTKEKEITEPIKKYVDRIEVKMGEWYQIEEARRDKERKRLEDEAIAKAEPEECDVIVPVVESVKTTRGQVATSTAIKHNDFELIDETLVPREYLMIDESKIKYAINKGGVKEIKGIKIIEKVRFNSR